MKIPFLFANPVKDLTMARYLAAKEVDFIGIDLDRADEKTIKLQVLQFREWIEGPKLIGVTENPQKLHETELNLDGYCFEGILTLETHFKGFSLKDSSIIKPNSPNQYQIVKNIADALPNISCMLTIDIQTEPVFLKNITGFMFVPGSEEKIGLFNFEKLDDWFDQIENLYRDQSSI